MCKFLVFILLLAPVFSMAQSPGLNFNGKWESKSFENQPFKTWRKKSLEIQGSNLTLTTSLYDNQSEGGLFLIHTVKGTWTSKKSPINDKVYDVDFKVTSNSISVKKPSEKLGSLKVQDCYKRWGSNINLMNESCGIFAAEKAIKTFYYIMFMQDPETLLMTTNQGRSNKYPRMLYYAPLVKVNGN